VIATFNVDQKSGRELRHYLATVAAQCSAPTPPTTSPSAAAETTHVAGRRAPVVIILDDLQHVGSPAMLADAFNALLDLPLQRWYALAHFVIYL